LKSSLSLSAEEGQDQSEALSHVLMRQSDNATSNHKGKRHRKSAYSDMQALDIWRCPNFVYCCTLYKATSYLSIRNHKLVCLSPLFTLPSHHAVKAAREAQYMCRINPSPSDYYLDQAQQPLITNSASSTAVSSVDSSYGSCDASISRSVVDVAPLLPSDAISGIQGPYMFDCPSPLPYNASITTSTGVIGPYCYIPAPLLSFLPPATPGLPLPGLLPSHLPISTPPGFCCSPTHPHHIPIPTSHHHSHHRPPMLFYTIGNTFPSPIRPNPNSQPNSIPNSHPIGYSSIHSSWN